MANTILNFHFDYPHPSLSVIYWAIIHIFCDDDDYNYGEGYVHYNDNGDDDDDFYLDWV